MDKFQFLLELLSAKVKLNFMKTQAVLIALIIISMLSSCTIEKRRYMDGYHVEWNSRQNKTSIPVSAAQESPDKNLAILASSEDKMEKASLSEMVVAEPVMSLKKVENPSSTDEPKESKKTGKIADKDMDFRNSSKEKHTGLSQLNLMRRASNSSGNVNVNTFHQTADDNILLLILAIFIPPLAVFLFEGKWNNTCWINLLLTIFFFLPGIIHAFWVILR